MPISKHIFLFLILIFSSCGRQVDRTEEKTYILALQSGDPSFKPLLKRMVDDYNSNLGFKVLEFTDSVDSSNSAVVITKGLEAKDGKVGWGQWLSSTERRNAVIPVVGGSDSESVKYSLRVEFDQDFLESRSKSEVNGQLSYDIRKLFAHEIGHGFQMLHVPEVTDVMYEDISGSKNFDSYWPRVRAFFKIP